MIKKEKSDKIVIELTCHCGNVTGTMTLPRNAPNQSPDPADHGIEKVECDDCIKKNKGKEKALEPVK